MKTVLISIGVAALAAIIGLAAASGAWVFWEVWKGEDRDAYRSLLGAFSGALFAFLFLRLGDSLKRLFERQEKDHYALNRAQLYLNDSLITTRLNLPIIDGFLNAVADLEGGSTPRYLSRFQRYELDKAVLLDLANRDFVNELIRFNTVLHKLNEDMATGEEVLRLEWEAFAAGKSNAAHYVEALRRMREDRKNVRKFLLQVEEDLVRLLAIDRYLLTHPPFFLHLLLALTRRGYSKTLRAQLPKEMQAMRENMAANSETGQKVIDATRARGD